MKKISIIILLCSLSSFLHAQDFNASMADIMKSMKAYTLEMVELMPAGKFDFKPADSVRSFRGQVQHMIATNQFLMNYYLIGDQQSNRDEEIQKAFAITGETDKGALIDALSQQFDHTIKFFKEAGSEYYQKTYSFGTPEEPLEKDYFATAMLIRDHITHHRAQLIIYLRVNDIEPAQFRGF